ncbi:hypothetical protein K4A83_13785, partial [Spirulina subsalsa FACHB-351]
APLLPCSPAPLLPIQQVICTLTDAKIPSVGENRTIVPPTQPPRVPPDSRCGAKAQLRTRLPILRAGSSLD